MKKHKLLSEIDRGLSNQRPQSKRKKYMDKFVKWMWVIIGIIGIVKFVFF